MTRPAEHRTPLDDTIDAVAREMTLVRTPDLRLRVADARGRAARLRFWWWRPASACAAVLVTVLAWWTQSAVTPVQPRRLETIASSRPAPPASTAPRVPRAELSGPRSGGAVRMRTTAPRPAGARGTAVPEAAWPETSSLPAVAVEPISIDALRIEAAVGLTNVEMPRLVVEPLDVEPLSRNNP